MKSKTKNIIRNILLGAIASLYNTNAQASDCSSEPLLEGLSDKDKQDAVGALKNKIIRNVLQIKKNGDTKMIAGHRSHMSHRSGGGGGGGHYSHASHYSSYGSGGNSRHSSHSSHSSSTTYSAPRPAPKTYKTYNLGDRTLKSGLYGNDVSKLTALLVSKNYLNSSWITMQNGYLYNSAVVSAVKRFQKDAGKAQDGVMTASLASELESWDASKSTLVLGIRNIQYNSSIDLSGNDVNELIALLRSAGFPPDPSKLKYVGNKAIFTEDIETAVKLFQAYNGLTPDGLVDETTINKLKAKAR